MAAAAAGEVGIAAAAAVAVEGILKRAAGAADMAAVAARVDKAVDLAADSDT